MFALKYPTVVTCDDVVPRQVGLPGTVEAHESVEGVPESVWKKVMVVKQGGGGLAELRDKVGGRRALR